MIKPNADGTIKYQFRTDFSGINAVIAAEPNPLPIIQKSLELLDRVGDCYFSTIDLSCGNHLIPIAPVNQEKTAFTTAEGTSCTWRSAYTVLRASSKWQAPSPPKVMRALLSLLLDLWY